MSYSIQIADKDGNWLDDTTYCDGTDPTIKSSATCTIPMSVLRDPTGRYKLARSQLITARVAVSNVLGFGPYSAANTLGANV